ncbi:MAG: peptidoglycan-binding domain-containing protein [Eubacteriales bacterium]|nr:peptidoglycan-binding domain-containing protein [Eubacteriales bacterium]
MGRKAAVITLALGLLLGTPAALSEGLPQPSSLGDMGTHVKALQEQLQSRGYDPGEIEGAFTWETLGALMDFQRDNGLIADGSAGRDTLLVLFGKALDMKGATEMPYWYGGGSEVIPWGAVFQAQDVRTGIVFTARRMGGYSHLDAEPLGPFDTAPMFAAYGGEWSWDRRPVLLKFEGRVFAASMNGMPHGFSSIKGNGMPGHFCVHFFGSRGDGSQRVSDTHQACVAEASRAAWREP